MAIDNIKQTVLNSARIDPSCDMLEITTRRYRRWVAQIKVHGTTPNARPQAVRERPCKHSITPEIKYPVLMGIGPYFTIP